MKFSGQLQSLHVLKHTPPPFFFNTTLMFVLKHSTLQDTTPAIEAEIHPIVDPTGTIGRGKKIKG